MRCIWRGEPLLLVAVSTFVRDTARVIRGMLAEHDINQTKLGEALGRSQAYVSERENGLRGWTTVDMDVIAGLLGLTPAEFLVELTSRAQSIQERRGVLLDDEGEDPTQPPSEPPPGRAPRRQPSRSRRG